MDPIYIVLIILGILLLLVIFWIIGEINAFRRMLVKIDESESSIDVALTKRFDLLSKMFQAAKGYMKHEAETLQKVVAMRQPAHAGPRRHRVHVGARCAHVPAARDGAAVAARARGRRRGGRLRPPPPSPRSPGSAPAQRRAAALPAGTLPGRACP